MATHPSLEPITALIGEWRGTGQGEYPTIQPFRYIEELSFRDVGTPFLVYTQRTWGPRGQPMHTETGYFRVPNEHTVELVLAHPTGQTELAEGEIEATSTGFTLKLHAHVVNTTSAKPVHRIIRTIELNGDRLRTTMEMAAVGVEMTQHLTSVLTRVEPDNHR